MKDSILSLFASDPLLTFSEIKKKTKIRSNHLAYWTRKLVNQKILEKTPDGYKLADTSEYLLPYLSASRSTLPVILIKIGQKGKFYLIKRTKRPYKDLLALPGGRLIIGESIQQAAIRIMKTKHNIDITNPQIQLITLEHLTKNKSILFSFLLILISANSINPLELTNIKKSKKNIVPSDFAILNKSPSIYKISQIKSVYK